MNRHLLTLAGIALCAGQVFAQTQEVQTFSCVADTWIRSNDLNASGSTNASLEFRKSKIDGTEEYANWVALMGFNYSVPAGKKVMSATLHVITERTKGGEVSLRGFSNNFAENATWATEGTYVEADLKTTPIWKASLAGQYGTALFDGGIAADKQNLAAWTNDIDVTNYVQSLGSSAKRVNFMFSQDGETQTNDNRIYSKDNTGCVSSKDPIWADFTAAQLMPELIVTFVDESVATYIIKNENTGVEYSSLAAAWDAAATNDVLLLNQDVTLSTRLDTKERNITIKGNGNVTISRAAGYNNGMLFLTSNGGDELTLENLTIDGANIKTNAQLIEAGNGGTLYLNDVKIINCVTENSLGVIAAKSSGKVKANGLVMTGCTVPAGMGEIFVGSGGSSIAGDCTFSLFAENTNNVDAEGLTAGKVTICEGDETFKHAEGAAVVTGAKDANLFVLDGSDNKLQLDANGNITIVDETATGIEDITFGDADAPVEYYTIQGMRVENPVHGLYIVKKGNKVAKIVL